MEFKTRKEVIENLIVDCISILIFGTVAFGFAYSISYLVDVVLNAVSQ